MAAYGLLSATELRLLDRILATGAFASTPASAPRAVSEEDRERDSRRFEGLKHRSALVKATAERVGDCVQYGSIAELLRILSQTAVRRRSATATKDR